MTGRRIQQGDDDRSFQGCTRSVILNQYLGI